MKAAEDEARSIARRARLRAARPQLLGDEGAEAPDECGDRAKIAGRVGFVYGGVLFGLAGVVAGGLAMSFLHWKVEQWDDEQREREDR